MEFCWYVIAGLFGGVLGGMGMGGGTILIPLLSIFYSVGQHSSQAVNLISFIPMAIVALILHFKNGLVEKKGIFLVIIPALLLAVIGSLIASKLDEKLLSKIFGGFLLALSILQFFSDKITDKI